MFWAQTGRRSKGELRIGYSSSLVGGNRPQSLDVVNGAEIAIKEVNAAGGILGRQVKFVFLDNENEIRKAVARVKELIVKHKIDFGFSIVQVVICRYNVGQH